MLCHFADTIYNADITNTLFSSRDIGTGPGVWTRVRGQSLSGVIRPDRFRFPFFVSQPRSCLICLMYTHGGHTHTHTHTASGANYALAYRVTKAVQQHVQRASPRPVFAIPQHTPKSRSDRYRDESVMVPPFLGTPPTSSGMKANEQSVYDGTRGRGNSQGEVLSLILSRACPPSARTPTLTGFRVHLNGSRSLHIFRMFRSSDAQLQHICTSLLVGHNCDHLLETPNLPTQVLSFPVLSPFHR